MKIIQESEPLKKHEIRIPTGPLTIRKISGGNGILRKLKIFEPKPYTKRLLEAGIQTGALQI